MSKRIRLGTLDDGRPLEFSVDELAEAHWSIRGRTGQRKTLLLMLILMQYIAMPDHCVVWIDLGGDQFAVHFLEEAARKAGKPFYLFALGQEVDGCSWDPLLNTPAFRDDLASAANGIAQGLALSHPDGYGRSFWSRLNASEINLAFDNLLAQGNSVPSFADFTNELCELAKASRNRSQISESYLAAQQLLRYSAIATRREKELFLGRAIDQSAVVAFHLPTAHHGAAAKAVASLASWCTTVEAYHRTAKGMDEKVTTHLAIDEFAQVASGGPSALNSTLTLARKWRLRLYMVYQDSSQLETPDGSLNSILRSQTQQVLFTSETEEEQRELRFESKDTLRTLKSDSYQSLTASTSVREFIDPTLTRNEILDTNGIAMKAYGVFKLGDKHRAPIAFTIDPPTTRAEHARLSRKPLPPLPKEFAEAEKAAVAKPSRKSKPSAMKCSLPGLSKLLTKIHAEERWQLGGSSDA